jgi:hypothetical protein
MDRPGPRDNWRDFLKEIGIVVIGVLIALSAQQTVDWLHWRADVAEARAALRDEIRTNAAIAAMRAEEGRCIPTRLDEIVAWANGGPRPDVAAAQAAQFTGPTSTVWELTKAGQTVARMPLKERMALARFYSAVTNQESVIQNERAEVVRLARYLDKPSLTPDERRRMLEDVAEARTWFRIGRNNNLWFVARAKEMGLTPKPLSPANQARLALFCRTTPAQAS